MKDSLPTLLKNSAFWISVVLSLFLTNCGENSTSQDFVQVEKTGVEMVASLEDLPECTENNEGTQVWVKDENGLRVCVDAKWFSVLKRDSLPEISCTVEELADGNGVKVLCNGDSIGIVEKEVHYDGDTSEVQKEGDSLEVVPDTSGLEVLNCRLDKADSAVVSVICGNDTTRFPMKEPSVVDEIDSEKVVVSLDSVQGVSQKGPFLSGSKVVVRELTDGRTLKQTGNSFKGKIIDDKGEFKINARSLVSQYVTLEATGYYRNEVTGENTNSELTLFAITDVSQRNIANINLLTHLEYGRVDYLVTKLKRRVNQAKKQAQKEVLDLFYIDAEGFSNSEDLSIAGSSDEDGALLAVSVLLQGDRSVAQLSELLTVIARDMTEDGKWDDEKTRMEIAEWAADADSSGRLDSIRLNVEKWGLSPAVPNFEKYVRRFWSEQYGLGDCGVLPAGTVVAASAGKRKGTKTRYVCKDDEGESYWTVADDFTKDTFGWTPGDDGQVKQGSVTENHYYLYDAEGARWRPATLVEQILGGCVASVSKDSLKNKGFVNGFWYHCNDRAWEKTNAYVDSIGGWIEDSDGYIKNDGGEFLVYDEGESSWRPASSKDVELKLMGCTKNRTGEYGRSRYDNMFYRCEANHDWVLVTDKVEYNTIGLLCDKDGAVVSGVFNTGSKFVCDNGAWREMTGEEEEMGGMCIEGNFYKDSTYVCDKEHKYFRNAAYYDFDYRERDFLNPDIEYGEFLDERDGHRYKTIRIGDLVWMAENLNYADERADNYLVGNNKCYNGDASNCLKGGRIYTWFAAMNVDSKWWNVNLPEGMIDTPYHRGICPEGWHIPTKEEFETLNSSGGYADFQAKTKIWWSDATNATGLTVLRMEYSVKFWSATEKIDTSNNKWGYYAIGWKVEEKTAAIVPEMTKSGDGYVRCVQDAL
ncbi:MAG: hypothetical protein IKZ45_02465 [Fibrobacter sp.]|nr:hypothetical protein [Fibrobacter sp.]